MEVAVAAVVVGEVVEAEEVAVKEEVVVMLGT